MLFKIQVEIVIFFKYLQGYREKERNKAKRKRKKRKRDNDK